MAKLNVVLLAMLLACALLLVTSQHRARKGFIELERAQAAARRHEVAWNQLRLEQTRLAKHALIDAVARRDLKMQPVTPDRTLFLSAPESVARTPGKSEAPAAAPAPAPAGPTSVAAAVVPVATGRGAPAAGGTR
jgi:cell division protein FtsL